MGSRGLIARIALAIPVPDLFDYEVPPSLDAQVVPGARVRVPFGRGVRLGYCIDRATTSEHDKLKAIEAVVDDAPLLEPDLLALIDWTARYYLCSIGEVIEAAVPKAVREGKRRAIRWARLLPAAASFADGGQGANLRTRILETLHDRGPLPLSELLEASEAGESSAKTLAKRGAIEIVRAPTREFGGPLALLRAGHQNPRAASSSSTLKRVPRNRMPVSIAPKKTVVCPPEPSVSVQRAKAGAGSLVK